MSVTPKKHLGQHFLKEEQVVRDFINHIDFHLTDNYLEIGPGMGILTKALLHRLKKLTIVEIDAEAVEYIQKNFTDDEDKLEIMKADFLKIDLDKLFTGAMTVLGNFPYNISSQILFKVWENQEKVVQVVGMFQKEVAERVCAKPGGKEYGILSVLMQLIYDTEYLFTVSPDMFIPPPRVQSAVIKLVKKPVIAEVDFVMYKNIVKTAFQQRRKKLRNALKVFLPEEHSELDRFLDLRAEQLSIEDFIAITRILAQKK